MCEELISSSWEKNHMSNFSYTISIGQLVEQLTLNQWVLGSSPRWCTKGPGCISVRDFFLCENEGRNMKIKEAENRTSILVEQLLRVWESSVRATHLFLSDVEIEHIKIYVPQFFAGGSPALSCRR